MENGIGVYNGQFGAVVLVFLKRTWPRYIRDCMLRSYDHLVSSEKRIEQENICNTEPRREYTSQQQRHRKQKESYLIRTQEQCLL